MERITEKHLQAQIDRLNKLTNSPMKPYETTGKKYVAQIGNYHLDGAYGGWELMRMENEGGGVSSPLRTGHISKKELYGRISAFIAGIESRGL